MNHLIGQRLREFVKAYDIEERHGGLILYKTVTEKYAPWITDIGNHCPLALVYKYGNGSRNDACKALRGVYAPGSLVSCEEVDLNPNISCGQGLHVGTLRCAHAFHSHTNRIVECLVMPRDVVCIPWCALIGSSPSHQKIRCKRLQVLRDVILGPYA
jgi:hypothetical protein